MLTKTRLQNAERRWRHFVLDSRFTRVFVWSGITLALVAIFTPRAVTTLLMERGFGFWFGAFVLYFASAHLLTMLAAFTRRDFLTGIWMAVWTFAMGAVGCVALRFVLR